MKKVKSILVLLSMALILSGCGGMDVGKLMECAAELQKFSEFTDYAASMQPPEEKK